ncbi:MAG: phage tail tube protein [Bacteroidales bacterium]|jgi:hypothetical protein
MSEIFRYIGIGKETSFGSAADATIYLEPDSCSLDVPTEPEIVIKGGLGRMRRRKRPAFYSCGGNFVYAADVRSLGYVFRSVLDQYIYTAGDTLNTHEFYGGNENTPTSWTVRAGKDLFEHIFLGCVANQTTINVSDGLVTVTQDLFAQKDDPNTIKGYVDVSALLPEEYPLAFYEVAASVNGVAVSTICRSLDITVANNVSRDGGRHLSSRYATSFKSAARDITMSMELEFEDMDMLELFWGGSDGPTDTGSTLFPLLLAFDGGDYGSMEICLPNAMMTSVPTQTKGTDLIYQKITCRALMGEDVELADETTINTDILTTIESGATTLE